eukprot:RCo036412
MVEDYTDFIDSFGQRLLSTVWFWRKWRNVPREILHDLTGTIRPGKATLILGPPKSGKSSLMQVLSGRVSPSFRSLLTGTVTYNGVPRAQVLLPKVAAYLPPQDLHIPQLTVRETVEFAFAAVFGVDQLKAPPDTTEALEALLRVWRLAVEIQLTLMGIDHVGDVIVGNDSVRGISWGQRRAVTSAELLVNRYPLVFADEISTGQDTKTTIELCSSLVTYAHAMNATVAVVLLQPPPEVYELFDDLIMMAKGHIVYQGPAREAVPYFTRLGYHFPKATEEIDFLQEVTSDEGQRFLSADARESTFT